MDKTTFDNGILAQVEPNYILGLLEQVGQDRINMINNLKSAPSVLERRLDFLYVYSFASIVRSGLSSVTAGDLSDRAPELIASTTRWFDRSIVLASQLQALRNTASDVGILKDSLNFIPRR